MTKSDSLQRLLGLPNGVQVVWLGLLTCPRCGTPVSMRQPLETNALSRCTRGENDDWLYVCSPCGVDEGLLEFVAAETDQNVFANLQHGDHLDAHRRKLALSFGGCLNIEFAVDDPFVL